MSGSKGWNVYIENDCLFVNDLDSGLVALQHSAHPNIRPNIHPLRAPDGRTCITQDRPYHHPWQHGVTTGFHGVNGCDFWFDPGQLKGVPIGTIKPTSPRILESVGHPTWVVEAIWIHVDGSYLVAERQEWKLQRADKLLYLDLRWKFQAIVDVVIEKQPYGGLFVSVPCRKGIGGEIVNSERLTGAECEQQPAKWVDVWLPIEGSELGGGYAIFDHPENADHPSHWRVDDWLGVNPAPCIPGQLDLPTGSALRGDYRLVLHDGKLDPQAIDELFDAFAAVELPRPA